MDLARIQHELKAPKGQFNSFGKYKYRSCEDIVEAVKPILASGGCHLNLSDDVVAVGDRIYIKATASIFKGSELLGQSTAFAREPDDKKGMDASQITGTASSYARKYALNGLLAIDDTKDADTDEHTAQRNKASKAPVSALDPILCNRLHACQDVDELSAIWVGLTPDQRIAHNHIKNEVKARLA
jgi:hypothetical protein